MAAGFTVDVDSLRKLATHLRDTVSSLPPEPEPSHPQFGQYSDSGFAPATQLADNYRNRTTMWAASRNDFERGVRALAEALEIIAKRYQDNEQASIGDAAEVRRALAAGWAESGPVTASTPQPGPAIPH
ncbi:MAG TPA: hypothetical protein VMU51_05225 [Mycobacteriales bacterium]|nr:hypothetical protein [Mycobacteriales bacterium]